LDTPSYSVQYFHTIHRVRGMVKCRSGRHEHVKNMYIYRYSATFLSFIKLTLSIWYIKQFQAYFAQMLNSYFAKPRNFYGKHLKI